MNSVGNPNPLVLEKEKNDTQENTVESNPPACFHGCCTA